MQTGRKVYDRQRRYTNNTPKGAQRFLDIADKLVLRYEALRNDLSHCYLY